MILIINTCKEAMHTYEFVKPIEDILTTHKSEFKTINITDIDNKNIMNTIHKDITTSTKIILTGTSLRDFDYEKKDFSWIKDYEKPILGICAGFQIICKAYDCITEKGLEIGLKEVVFKKEFLGISGKIQAYCLHNSIIKDSKNLRATFNIIGHNEYIQAIIHKNKPTYATLFHPEVRNKEIIVNFLIEKHKK